MGEVGMTELVNVFVVSLVLMAIMSLAAFRWRKGHQQNRAYLWFDMIVLSLIGGVLIVMAMWLVGESKDVPQDVIEKVENGTTSLAVETGN